MALKQTSPRFWNKIAAKYARSPIANEDAYAHKLSVTQSYMRPDMHVMEFGCGTGGTALKHAPYVERYLATDFSQGMIDIARQKPEAAEASNVTFEVASIESMDIPQRPFDMILGLSILHLLRDHKGVMERVRSMLAPGGYFVTSTTCMGDMPFYIRGGLRLASRFKLIPHIEFFTRVQLKQDMNVAGFEILNSWQPGPRTAMFIVARKV